MIRRVMRQPIDAPHLCAARFHEPSFAERILSAAKFLGQLILTVLVAGAFGGFGIFIALGGFL